MKYHVHICLSILPKFAVANVVGSLKRKSAIFIVKNFPGRQRNFNGGNFGLEAIFFDSWFR